jgi:hypothetical protein
MNNQTHAAKRERDLLRNSPKERTVKCENSFLLTEDRNYSTLLLMMMTIGLKILSETQTCENEKTEKFKLAVCR